MENPTFFESLKEAFDKSFKNDKHFGVNQNLLNNLTLK
jgi:hypothetical protein